MKKLSLFLSLFLSFQINAAYWIEGESYLAYWDEKNPPQYFDAISSDSSTVDKTQCRMWVTEKGKLKSFDPKGTLSIHKDADKILSDFKKGHFITRSASQDAFETRNEKGNIVSTTKTDWIKDSIQLAPSKDQLWSLNENATTGEAKLLSLDSNLKIKTSHFIANKSVIWPNFKLLTDPLSHQIWIAYSGSAPNVGYSTYLHLFDQTSQKTFPGKVKSLFFDFCKENDGSILFTHDNPPLVGMTLPDASVVEKISPDGKKTLVYQAENDTLIDALHCEKDRVLMIQRSLWGSVGSDLVSWDRKSIQEVQTHFHLKGPAKKIHSCN